MWFPQCESHLSVYCFMRTLQEAIASVIAGSQQQIGGGQMMSGGQQQVDSLEDAVKPHAVKKKKEDKKSAN